MDIDTLRDFVQRGQNAQAAVDEIIKGSQPKSDAQKLIEIKEEMLMFLSSEQGAVATLDAIHSVVFD